MTSLTSREYHHQNSAETQKGERWMHTTFLTGPASWFWHDCVPATTGSTHACTWNKKSFLPQRVPVVRRTRQPSMFFRDTNQSESHRATSNSASPEIIWGLGWPEEDHQLHRCCWTGRVVNEKKKKRRRRRTAILRLKLKVMYHA